MKSLRIPPSKTPNLYNLMAVDVPVGSKGPVTIDRVMVESDTPGILYDAIKGRPIDPGMYTRLFRDGLLWMSDTPAERHDQMEAAYQIYRHGGRILIGGLGLGSILRLALHCPRVTEVDVLEIDPDVIDLVAPHYLDMAESKGIQLRVHEGDMYKAQWPRGTRWSVAWFDIWAFVSTDNLPVMTRLRRSYGRRCDWVGCWGEDMLR